MLIVYDDVDHYFVCNKNAEVEMACTESTHLIVSHNNSGGGHSKWDSTSMSLEGTCSTSKDIST